MRKANGDGSNHWWLHGAAGVIDLTLSPADRRKLKAGTVKGFAYEDGEGAMFRTGYKRPSQRASAIIELVKQQRLAS